MKIYFCDGCNESIPLADIQAGQVTTIKGKLFCRACIPPGGAGSPAAVAPPAARRGAGPLVWLVLLALVGWTAWRDLPLARLPGSGDAEASAELGRGEELRRLEAAERDLGRVVASRDELDRRLTFLRGDLDSLRGTAADVQRGVDLLADRVDGLERGQAETGQLIEKLAFQENRTRSLEARIDTLADVLARHDQLLAAGASVPAEGGAAAGGPAADAPSPVDATLAAELDSLRRALLDPDPGQRFAAVDRIAKERLKQLAPELLDMLGDEDGFVRILAMETLGDFGHVEAVPRLVDLLDDASGQIRKTAAQQLVRLTGYDPGYDPNASKADREKAVRKWKERLGLK